MLKKKMKRILRACCDSGPVAPEVELLPHGLLVDEVLTRLPAKSLMRFKSVSKLWCSAICDPCFVKAHRVRSGSAGSGSGCSLLMACPHDVDSKASYDYFNLSLPVTGTGEAGGELVAVHLFTVSPHECNIVGFKKEAIAYEFDGVTDVINGLFCLYSYDRVAICNVSTREILELPPLGSSNDHHYQNVSTGEIVELPPIDASKDHTNYMYHLGYVCASEEFKLLRVCTLHNLWADGEYCPMSEILTLGKDTSWRSLATSPPLDLKNARVYSNGSFFWWHPSGNSIIGFDFQLEMYQAVGLPPSIPSHGGRLYQFRNRLALVIGVQGQILELWAMEQLKNSSSQSSSECSWVNHLIEIPYDFDECYWAGDLPTGELLLTPGVVESEESPLPLYTYDRDKGKSERFVIPMSPSSSSQPSYRKRIDLLTIHYYEENITPLSYLISSK